MRAFRTQRSDICAVTAIAGARAPDHIRGMTRPLKSAPSPFTAPERDLLRREFCRRFGQDPAIADGIFLRTWRGGEKRGRPKIPPALQTMLERGLVEVRSTNRGPRAFFTESGMAALRQLLMDRRAMDPERFGHMRAELGLPIDNA
jgi:hypothetical protein